MRYCEVDIDIDIFKHKYVILENYTNEELEKELEYRKKFPENDFTKKKRNSVEFEFEVDLSEYEGEIIDKLDNDECIKHLEDNYYTVFHENDEYYMPGLNQQNLARMLGLKWWATKEQIMKELETIL